MADYSIFIYYKLKFKRYERNTKGAGNYAGFL
jgi:hypothetical protein